MSVSNGGGAANNAEVETDSAPHRQRLVDYHEQLAESAEHAVKKVERMIADLKESLKGRQVEAKQHREAAKRVRAGEGD